MHTAVFLRGSWLGLSCSRLCGLLLDVLELGALFRVRTWPRSSYCVISSPKAVANSLTASLRPSKTNAPRKELHSISRCTRLHAPDFDLAHRKTEQSSNQSTLCLWPPRLSSPRCPTEDAVSCVGFVPLVPATARVANQWPATLSPVST